MVVKVGTTIYLPPYINVRGANTQDKFSGIISYEYSIYFKEAANDQPKRIGKIRCESRFYFTLRIARSY